ncbi:CLIP-associated protein-like [Salvia miltiorrhiza]|uniref:CLIP-associated protein-like n=1 Tax=Salvia miltiorrhiza TaxID=226208 RepID=UPI0025AD1E8D|nr:CLIP-associated protein-like [Salvia miltiorrhiza]
MTACLDCVSEVVYIGYGPAGKRLGLGLFGIFGSYEFYPLHLPQQTPPQTPPIADAVPNTSVPLFRQVSSPTIIVDRVGSYTWMHRSWRIQEEFARTAIGLFAATELPLQPAILPPDLLTIGCHHGK